MCDDFSLLEPSGLIHLQPDRKLTIQSIRDMKLFRVHLKQPFVTMLARDLLGVFLLFYVTSALAAPRDTLPPLPEAVPVLYRETFDEYWGGGTNAEIVIGNYTFEESWSGYALQRAGTSVTPFVVPALDSGHTNITCNTGAIRFWFKPYWSSGTGSGTVARLVELVAVGRGQSAVIWSLQASADGTGLHLLGSSDNGPVELLSTEINWRADQSHLITLDYSPNGTTLFIDGAQAATGTGTLAIPPNIGVLVLGSTFLGENAAEGDFDELYSFNQPLAPEDVTFYYHVEHWQAVLGPVTPEEEAAQEAMYAELAAQQSAARTMTMNGLMDEVENCVTGGPVYLTNVTATVMDDQTVTVSFDIAGGTNGVAYDIYSTTNLAASPIATQWTWLGQGYTCNSYTFTNQPFDGAFYALAIPQETMVVAWGANDLGQSDVPSGLTNVIAVAGVGDFSVALKADGTVVAWGDNYFGETNVPAGLSNVVSIANGDFHALALLQGGTVVGWGDNNYGQTNVPGDLTNATAIAAGDSFSMALRDDGTVVVWGANTYGQTNVPALEPATRIAAGRYHCVALLTNSTVTVWGYNGGFGWNITNVPVGLSNVTAIAAGDYHTLALKADGTMVAWGAGTTTNANFGNYGQSMVPEGLSNVVAIAGGGFYSMALRADGTVVVWGDDSYGQTDVPYGLTGVKAIAAGYAHGLAIRSGKLTPVILEEPGDQYALAGGTVTFTALGEGVAGVSYQWQFSGMDIEGATNATLTLTNVSSANEGSYRVVISNEAGSVRSAEATFSIIRPPQIASTTPALGTSWITNNAPNTVYQFPLTVTATDGDPVNYPLSYQWRINGTIDTNIVSAVYPLSVYDYWAFRCAAGGGLLGDGEQRGGFN